MKTEVLSSSSLTGDSIKNESGEELGSVKDIMIDLEDGSVAYLVMSSGGILGMGDKYFAIPWGMVRVDLEDKSVVIDASEETFENAPGFDKDNWPESPAVSKLEHY